MTAISNTLRNNFDTPAAKSALYSTAIGCIARKIFTGNALPQSTSLIYSNRILVPLTILISGTSIFLNMKKDRTQLEDYCLSLTPRALLTSVLTKIGVIVSTRLNLSVVPAMSFTAAFSVIGTGCLNRYTHDHISSFYKKAADGLQRKSRTSKAFF